MLLATGCLSWVSPEADSETRIQVKLATWEVIPGSTREWGNETEGKEASKEYIIE